MNITTPCHAVPLTIYTTQEGSGHLTRDVPDEIICSADGCLNTWDRHGIADEWNIPAKEIK